MLGADEVRTVHAAMLEHVQRERWTDAAALVRRLEGWSADDLNSVELADLWWSFCEQLADVVAPSEPACAARLYDLASTSFAKEGAQATGAGEGLRSVADVKRVEAKRATLLR